jgi:GT2 family glycosyltransferase
MQLIPTNPSVYIIILNWNGYYDTKECLHSLEKINYKAFKILVIDNGSSNDDCSKLIENFPNIELIKSDKNLGFSGGNNLGIIHALKQNPDYILLLNNDTIITPYFLDLMTEVFEKHLDAGIVSPIINYYSDRNKIWSAGGKINKLRSAGISFQKINKMIQNEFEVNFVSGCCMLIRKGVFEKVGLFDENYFLYVEDTDLCFRTIKAGYKIFVTKTTNIYHKVSQSSSKNSSALPIYYTTRNRLYFSKKNYPIFFLLTSFYISLVMIIKIIAWLITAKVENIYAVIKAYYDFLTNKMGKTSKY